MEPQEKSKNTIKGYGLALFIPDEFKNAIKTKLTELSEKSPDKERWEAMAKGFEMGLSERTQDRLKEIEKVKQPRGRSQGRAR